MNNQSLYEPSSKNSSHIVQDSSLQRQLIQRVFLWMTAGLSITGLTAYVALDSPAYWSFLASNSYMIWGLMIANILLVMGLQAGIRKMSFAMATLLFGLYSVLNGLSLAPILYLYTETSIAQTFFITAGTFASMAVYGYVTKRDLTKMGSLLFMALIGIIIASVVNMFLGAGWLSLGISALGVLIFVGLTAYDVQVLKNWYAQVYEDDEEVKKLSVIGALHLYLDFINLFLYLLRFFGDRK